MSARDAPAFAATIDRDVVIENRWDPHVREEYIRAVSGSRLRSTWAICERSTGAIVGAISLNECGEHEVELGVWIGAPNRGRRYTSDAVSALVRLLADSTYSSISASTAETNVPMQSALRRAGFAEQARYTHQFTNGESIPAIRFSRTLKG
jgi:RimJ/RimL family protein N-acetyltransferase